MTDPLNLHDYEQLARERLPQMVYDYFAGGAGAEITLRENEAAWGRLRLRPRVLVDVSACDLSTTILGQPAAMPIMIAPCALNTLAHPDGELAVARAAAAAGAVYVVTTLAGYRLEDVAAAASGPRWFQLYCYRDRGITRDLVQRAEAAGYAAICVTVDVPVHGPRERDARNRFKLPSNTPLPNFAHPARSAAPGPAGDGPDHMADTSEGSALGKYIKEQFDPTLTWKDLAWLRGLSRLPLVVKGILTGDDARLAVEHGVAGIGVSNHGGRQLDTVLATADALPEIADAAAGRAEIFVDGGIRRGADVLKALALGACAVLIGRPYLWALALDGEAGVQRMLQLLRDDLRTSMALCGCRTVADIGSALVR